MSNSIACRTCLLAVYVLIGHHSELHAHDLWLIPPEKPALNKQVLLLAHSGMEFPLSEHAPNPSKFKKRMLLLPDGTWGTLDAAGTEERSGLMHLTPTKPGIYQAAVQTEPRLITLAAEEFNHYLVSDGLPHIYQLRFKEKSLHLPATERYSKSPKVLFQVGTEGQGDATVPMGLTLEIVPLKNPLELKVGQSLPVKVLFQQKALANAHLGWDVPGDGIEHSGTVRTNANGVAHIPMAQSGLMTIRLTHMTRPKTAEYEWESFWTSLTFRLP